MQIDAWGNVRAEHNSGDLYQPIRLPGQHADGETGLYYNRHRYYEPGAGIYINQDIIGLMGGVNACAYTGNRPIDIFDPLGLTGCIVNFPDYPVEYSPGKTSTWLGGHSGILTYDSKGVTSYYEYGRYLASKSTVGVALPQNEGNVRRVGVLDLKINADGIPTDESMEKLKKSLSEQAGKGTRVVLTCQAADPENIVKYAEELARDQDRPKYSWNPFNSHQCRDFSASAMRAGRL